MSALRQGFKVITQYSILASVGLASMLAGATVVHVALSPDLSLDSEIERLRQQQLVFQEDSKHQSEQQRIEK